MLKYYNNQGNEISHRTYKNIIDHFKPERIGQEWRDKVTGVLIAYYVKVVTEKDFVKLNGRY